MSDENNVRRSGRARQSKRPLSPTPPPSRPSSSSRKTDSRTPSLPLTETPSTSACNSRSGSRLPDIPMLEEEDGPYLDGDRIVFPQSMRGYTGIKIGRLLARAREKYGIGKGKRRKPAAKRKDSNSRKPRAVRNEHVEDAGPVEKEADDKGDDSAPVDVPHPDEPEPLEGVEDDVATAEEYESDSDDEVIKKARMQNERENDFEAAMNHIDPTLIAGGSRRKIIPKKAYTPPPQVSTFSNINEAELEMEELSVEADDEELQDVPERRSDSSRSLSVEVLDPVEQIPQPAASAPIRRSVPSATNQQAIAPEPVPQPSSSQPVRRSVVPPAPTPAADDDDDEIQIIKTVAGRPRQPMPSGPRPIIARYSRPNIAPPPPTGPPSQITYRANGTTYVPRSVAEKLARDRSGRYVEPRRELIFSDCTTHRPRVHVLSRDKTSAYVYEAESQHFANVVRFHCIFPHTDRTFLELVTLDDGTICAYEFGRHNEGCRRPKLEFVRDYIYIAKVRSQWLIFVKTTHQCVLSEDTMFLSVPTGNVTYEFRYFMNTSMGHTYTSTCGCPAQCRMTKDTLWVNYTHNPTCDKFKLAQAYADTGVAAPRQAMDVDEVPGPSNRRSAPLPDVAADEIQRLSMAYRQDVPFDEIPGPPRPQMAPFREIPAYEVPGPSNSVMPIPLQEDFFVPVSFAARLNLPPNPANIAWLEILSARHQLGVKTRPTYAYWDRIKPHRHLQAINLGVWGQGPAELDVILAVLLLGDANRYRALITHYKEQFLNHYQILGNWSHRDYRKFRPDNDHITRTMNSACTKTLIQFMAVYAGFRLIVFLGMGREKHMYGDWSKPKNPLAVIKKCADSDRYEVAIEVTDA
uniref:ULP_PROTEASE domain-containing protein n=1 Tax=Panagrellus redivivus TaxID=6233 RepID=A0A7E4VQC6_PANRE